MSFQAACRSVAIDDTFRRIDAHLWDHTMTFEMRSDPDPLRSARGAMALAVSKMSPAELVQAQDPPWPLRATSTSPTPRSDDNWMKLSAPDPQSRHRPRGRLCKRFSSKAVLVFSKRHESLSAGPGSGQPARPTIEALSAPLRRHCQRPGCRPPPPTPGQQRTTTIPFLRLRSLMKIALCKFLLAALVTVAATGASAQITFYEREGFRGEAFTTG